MTYHKDKFISKTLYDELRGLEIKKNGRVDHSDLTHDDQIFSYLMALYVWYEGKNLKEIFGIEKFGIKTEESVDDIVELDGATNAVDMTPAIAAINTPDGSVEQKIQVQNAEMNKAKGVLFSEFVNKERKLESEHLKLLLRDENAREAYAKHYGVPKESVDINDASGSYDSEQTLPASLFTDFNKDEEEMSNDSIYKILDRREFVYDEDDMR